MKRQLSPKEFEQMQLEFSELSIKQTKPEQWQTFFEKHPYALSSMLPFSVRSEPIKPIANKADPDVILYAHRGGDQTRFGMIELTWFRKEQMSSHSYRSLSLLPDIEIAHDFCRRYAIQGEATLSHADRNMICIVYGLNVFLIAGMGQETCDTFEQKISESGALPQGAERLSYESISELFSAKVRPQIVILYPSTSTGEGDTTDVLAKLRMDFRQKEWESSACG